ncbi:hypothetical protein EYF80_024100 [Liparis tanakae]|uniref:Uncharacterized protein n=1 Tax=Liparis tanakae TaxID=230148 RepID=A0A4Z2HIR0_9TELE|nr:hypothetical protein EYF80_024100 [Liparis tanakae]
MEGQGRTYMGLDRYQRKFPSSQIHPPRHGSPSHHADRTKSHSSTRHSSPGLTYHYTHRDVRADGSTGRRARSHKGGGYFSPVDASRLWGSALVRFDWHQQAWL